MTEAREFTTPHYVGDARIKVRPGPELSHALERFINPEYVRELGGRAIDLVSEKTLHVYNHPFEDTSDNSRPPGLSKGELAILSKRLDERQRAMKPMVSPYVMIGQYKPPEEFKHEGNGIDMRFTIVIDELTERLLAKTVFLDQGDREGGKGLHVHLPIKRPDMQLGVGLLNARDDLLDLIRHKPQRVETMYIDTDALKP